MEQPTLPARERAAEDRCVAAWADSDDTDGLIELISAAVQARRPQLAARLVGLLGEHVEIEAGSALDRAQRSARFLLHQRGEGEQQAADELCSAWTDARRGRMRRLKARLRSRGQQPLGVLGGQTSPTRRRPRLTGRYRRG